MGADASAPAFKAITEEALRILNVPKELPETLVAEETEPADQKKNEKIEEGDAIADLATEGVLAAEDEDSEGASVVAAASAPVPVGPKVPNFRGKTMRATGLRAHFVHGR